MFQVTKSPHIGYIQISPRQDSSKTLQTFTIDTNPQDRTSSLSKAQNKSRTLVGDS